MTLVCRGVRGATTVEADRPEEILAATKALLETMIETNGIEQADVASIIFTTSPDLVSEYPALGARQMGWTAAPLLCTHEMAVPHGLEKCIRILLHWNTNKGIDEIEHIYLNRAVRLRPDIALKELNNKA